MNKSVKRALGGFAAAGAVALVMAGAVFLPGISQAADDPTTTPTTPDGIGVRSRGDQSAALAAALGITVEELQAAQESAASAAIDQALAEGLLTEEQAAQLRERNGGGRFGRFGSTIDTDALLADALGVSVAELDAAREQVQTDLLAQAVAEGRITQEQADLAQAAQALHDYLEPKVEAFTEQALEEAVTDGIITQEQLDALQSEGWGMRGIPGVSGRGLELGGRGHGGGHGGGRGHGGRMAPDSSGTQDAPATSPSTTPVVTPEGNG